MTPEERELVVSMLAALRSLLHAAGNHQALDDLSDAYLIMRESYQ